MLSILISPESSPSARRILSLAHFAAVTFGISALPEAHGATVTMTASDTANAAVTSFNGDLDRWSNTLAPASGNAYVNAAFLLRSPNSGTSHSFAGDSLTLTRNASAIGRLLFKGPDGDAVTIGNLILNGGLLDLGAGIGTFTTNLRGRITVQAGNTSYINVEGDSSSGAGGETLNISALLTGSGMVQIGGIGGLRSIEGLTVPTAAVANSAGTVKLSSENSFSGSMTVAGSPVNTVRGGLQLANANALQNATLVLATMNSGSVPSVSFLSTANTRPYKLGGLSGTANLRLTDTADKPVVLDVGGNNSSTTYQGTLNGPGSIIKSGTGTLTFSNYNAFTGGTTVSSGMLVMNSPCLADGSAVSISSGVLHLNYSGTDTVRTLVLNGVSQAGGTYDATNSGGRISGSGKLYVDAPVSGHRSTRAWKPYDGVARGTGSPVGNYFAPRFMPVSDAPSSGAIQLAGQGQAATIYYSSADSAVVGIAAKALRDDIQRVTGVTPVVSTATPAAPGAIFIGTIGKSSLIDSVVDAGKIDASGIRGKWEAYTAAVVENPLPGVSRSLVIAGSDRRGTAFGVFALSESMGVSPWYWWGDVAVPHKSAVYVVGNHTQPSPGVKYRGIFINDEDWGFQPWAAKTFEPEVGNVGPKTYAAVFELLLRLHANAIWPAMHEFPVDTTPFYLNTQNKVVADTYAIVISTSHHEPMLRNTHEYDEAALGPYNYWTNRNNIYNFWEQRVIETAGYENIYTMGMRGRSDAGMLAPVGTTDLQKAAKIQNEIIPDQRQMIADHVNGNPSEMPQIFIPYKETLVQYQAGLQLPPDVTILWPDDNHGYIRQLSNASERARPGGSGVYYHLSYWGAPRSYLWFCSTPPGMTCSEMLKAWDFEANRMWLVNVGDIKPHELGMEFYLRLARDPEAFRNFDQNAYFSQWAAHNFDPNLAEEIASVLDRYFRLNILKRPEHLDRNASGFSLVANGDEAQLRLDDFTALNSSADGVYNLLPAEQKPAFYEMVLFPIRASYLVNRRILLAERSRLWASQKRTATAAAASEAQAAHGALLAEVKFYNEVNAGGKWNGMMNPMPTSQLPGWAQETQNPFIMPSLGSYSPPTAAGLGVAIEGSTTPLTDGIAGELPVFYGNGNSKYFIDIFNTGRASLLWTAKADAPWITLTSAGGTADARIQISIDWSKAPRGYAVPGTITIEGAGAIRTVKLKAFYPLSLELSDLPEAVENNGKVSIEAEHFTTGRDASDGTGWRRLNRVAASMDGVTILPVTAASVSPTAITGSPSLTYEFYSFSSGAAAIQVNCLPTHKITSEHAGCRFAISLNGDTPQVMDINADEYSASWNANVLRVYASATSHHTIASAGRQSLKLWMLDAGVVLDKLIISIAGGSFEAENLPLTTSGNYHAFEESIASAGAAISLDATAVGQSITFALPSLTPGDYNVTMRMKTGPSRGIAKMSVGESFSGAFTDVGSAFDLYSPSLNYATLAAIRVNISSSTPKYLKFTVASKNGSSSGYWIVPDSFTFASVSDPATPINSWRSTYFGTPLGSGDAADTADADRDGIPNLLEYASASYPTLFNLETYSTSETNDHLTFTFLRAKDAIDVTYRVMAVDNLLQPGIEIWSSASTSYSGGTAPNIPVTVTDPKRIGESSSRFLWLEVTRP